MSIVKSYFEITDRYTSQIFSLMFRSPSSEREEVWYNYTGESRYICRHSSIKMSFLYFQVSFLGEENPQKIPGDSHKIEIQSSPYSHVGILAVDQSVYLLRNDKHLTHNEV